MTTGIGATITTLMNGTTANASDVMASLNSLNNNGVSNDSGHVTTDGSGGVTLVKVSNGSGVIRAAIFTSDGYTPYTFINGATINSGVTNTYTLTGGSTGVPTGAKAAWVNCYYTSATPGAFVQMFLHGATLTDLSYYPIFGIVQVNGVVVTGSAWVPLDASGQADAKANNANCTGIHASIMGYLI